MSGHSRELSARGKQKMMMHMPKLNGALRIVYAKMLVEMRDYGNEATRQSEQKFGAFVYDQD